ncbi:MAG TPA: phosphatidate cytidylyltransferase, partial [candidate division Zixibacteria bacterium]|nr:phosphatidate cytidylyltransferase [candidate division Zixibacteria bacterium]
PIVMPAGALVGAIYLWSQGGTLWAAWLTAITILPALFLIRATSPRDFSLSWVLQAGGAIWLGLGFGALGALRALDPVYGFWWLVFLFANLWTGDTAAYLVGRRLGRRPLAPSISPKKTVAGAVGQIIMSGVVGSVFALVGWLPVSKALLITSALVIGVVGQVGDLFESALKRIAGVKDSSAIIPGHGGVLDRFDSTLFAAPTLYVIVSLWPD